MIKRLLNSLKGVGLKMGINTEKVCIVGGTGYVGGYVSARLTSLGYPVRVLSRRPARRRDHLVLPTLEAVECNVHDLPELTEAMKGCGTVINLCGILHATKRDPFSKVHVDLVDRIIEASRHNRVGRLIHLSAVGASDEAPSRYLKSKALGEQHVLAAADLAPSVLRPSVIFGVGDSFLNRFVQLAQLTMVLPLACPEARFAPVYVEDVASAVATVVRDNACAGQTYDLCGPGQYSLKELVEMSYREAGLQRRVLGLNDSLSKLQAKLFGLSPVPLITYDNYLSMQVSNVCEDNGFERLGIKPSSLEAVLPRMFGRDVKTVRFNQLRGMASRG